MSLKRILAVVLACVFVAALTPGAMAEQEGDGFVWLFNDGADDNVSATTDWRFYVEVPAYVALDDSDGYWNFTCYAQMVNNTGSASTGDWNVTVYIESDGINKSDKSTMTVSKTALVYGNLSFADTAYSLFESNSSAVLTIVLENATSVEKDAYVGTLTIESRGAWASVTVMAGALVSVAVVVGIIGWMSGLMGDLQPGRGGSGGGGKKRRKKKRR